MYFRHVLSYVDYFILCISFASSRFFKWDPDGEQSWWPMLVRRCNPFAFGHHRMVKNLRKKWKMIRVEIQGPV